MISAGLSIREYGGYVFVNLHGELDVSDAASVAGALTAVAARNPRIIVDLAALVFIDGGADRRMIPRPLPRPGGNRHLRPVPRPSPAPASPQ